MDIRYDVNTIYNKIRGKDEFVRQPCMDITAIHLKIYRLPKRTRSLSPESKALYVTPYQEWSLLTNSNLQPVVTISIARFINHFYIHLNDKVN